MNLGLARKLLSEFNQYGGPKANNVAVNWRKHRLEFDGPNFHIARRIIKNSLEKTARVLGAEHASQYPQTEKMPVTGNQAETIKDRIAKAKERSTIVRQRLDAATVKLDVAQD